MKQDRSNRVDTNGKVLTNLRFADSIALFASNLSSMVNVFDRAQPLLRQRQLQRPRPPRSRLLRLSWTRSKHDQNADKQNEPPSTV
ncbi:unnamed protein product [Caenorhabditis auriculariae]|uniref:Uncharacterized protein n=1 Tax=Caenorhabditis auriculariae TaxID=2777116 RepID=A0A8S1GWH6_9PELO|nr:unnamed protein product [Caenorhabditis auriculariae]